MKTRSLVVLLILLAGTLAVAGESNSIKVGKKGDIMLSKETKVGELTLKPGHYQIQHRVVGTDHMIHFTELKGMDNPYYQTGPTGAAHPGEIKCRLQPMATKASRTVVYAQDEGGIRRITKVEIKGENVAHVF